jgi:hypothetical protein
MTPPNIFLLVINDIGDRFVKSSVDEENKKYKILDNQGHKGCHYEEQFFQKILRHCLFKKPSQMFRNSKSESAQAATFKLATSGGITSKKCKTNESLAFRYYFITWFQNILSNPAIRLKRKKERQKGICVE